MDDEVIRPAAERDKLKLAEKNPKDRKAYTVGKTEVVTSLLRNC